MLKLINFSTFDYDIKRFNYNSNKLISFLNKYNIDGVELLNPIGWQEKFIPKKIVKGVHLKYYPIWLDFWKSDTKELLKQFKSNDNIEKLYGGTNREVIVDQYKKEIIAADKTGAEYVVFHVAHVQLEHAFTYSFTYSDSEVIEATVELINEIFKDLNTHIKLLFENLWWPGLTMLEPDIMYKLLEKINYKNKGFMLDTAHLINTNFHLEDEKKAINYLLDKINNLGELKNFINGIHLNYSLSGKYVLDQINKYRKGGLDLTEINNEVYMHICNIDKHQPFRDKEVRKIVSSINPQYLIYEFSTSSFKQLEDYIKVQDEACGY
ncbi:TIM barrel protein [Clostridium lundense]|uniref:TIM barrel protein n=1 Tax=Clostridium lundense TaxID=319475 RepID=UPI000482B07C|nr:TIM barrel protein [Clostridium lundense]